MIHGVVIGQKVGFTPAALPGTEISTGVPIILREGQILDLGSRGACLAIDKAGLRKALGVDDIDAGALGQRGAVGQKRKTDNHD